MANYQPTYLGEINLSEETLTHYGVKGMKWRRRRGNRKNPKVDREAVWDRSGRVVRKSSLESHTPYGNRGLSITGMRLAEKDESHPGYLTLYDHGFNSKRKRTKAKHRVKR